MNKIRFTKASLDSLVLPERGAAYTYDDQVQGLLIGAMAGGAKTFYLQKRIDGKAVRVKIGR